MTDHIKEDPVCDKWEKNSRIKAYTNIPQPNEKYGKIIQHTTWRINKMTGTSTETFKKALDYQLRCIPNKPRIDNYGSLVAANSN